MTQQSRCWAYTLRKPKLKKTHVPPCSLQHYLQWLGHGSNLDVHQQMIKKLCSAVSCSLQPRGLQAARPLFSGILQARILKWVAIPFSRGSAWPRDWTPVSCILSRFFTIWATREAQVHIYSEIFFSQKKKLIWLSANNVMDLGAFYAMWSERERKTNIVY